MGITMNWHCEHCGHLGSVGLVLDLRPGKEAICPRCDQIMTVEDSLEVTETSVDLEPVLA